MFTVTDDILDADDIAFDRFLKDATAYTNGATGSNGYAHFNETMDEQVRQEKEKEERERQERRSQRKHEKDGGTRIFASDLPSGEARPPLVKAIFLAADGWTVLYANGETGKGLVSVWLAQQWLLDNPERDVAILDYEDHPREWGSRMKGMGYTDEMREQRVHYLTLPDILPNCIDLAKELTYDYDIGLWLVDSYTFAADPSDKLGGAGPAIDFFRETKRLPGTGLVLAHTSDDRRFPSKPFGSRFIHNGARETWAMAQNYVEQPRQSPGTINLGPKSRIQIEMRNKKRSEGARTSAAQFLDIAFWPGGKIDVRHSQGVEPTIAERVVDVLDDGLGYTAEEIAIAVNSDGGPVVKPESVARIIRNGIDGIGQEGDKKPYRHYSVQARHNLAKERS